MLTPDRPTILFYGGRYFLLNEFDAHTVKLIVSPGSTFVLNR